MNEKRSRYTKEQLEPLVKKSFSVAEVLRKLGRKQAGGVSTNLSKRIKSLGIDTSHFLGRARNQGVNHKGNKKQWDQVLVPSDKDRRTPAYRLRRALLESGRPYICEVCGMEPKWNGKELRFQVDHKNGNWDDNRPDNLQFICPNCHTQTTNYSGSKGKTSITGYSNNATLE